MRVLIVNNHSLHTADLPRLARKLGYRDTFVLEYEGLSFTRPELYDAVILSGAHGEGMPLVAENAAKLRSEFDLARNQMRPLLGICYGCQVVAHAFGAGIEPLPEPLEQQVITITLTAEGRGLLDPDSPDGYQVYVSHKNRLASVPPDFTVLAESEYGPEIIMHNERPLLGTMFHPEVLFPENDGFDLVVSLFEKMKNR